MDGIDDGKRGRNLLNGGVSLDVNDCHHRIEAGGLRECVADLLPYVVNCSERE